MVEKSSGFWSGFLFGAIVGGTVGAIVAVALSKEEGEGDSVRLDEAKSLDPSQANSVAKRSLEQKIAQLNSAIDAVSRELSVSEGNGRKQVTPE